MGGYFGYSATLSKIQDGYFVSLTGALQATDQSGFDSR